MNVILVKLCIICFNFYYMLQFFPQGRMVQPGHKVIDDALPHWQELCMRFNKDSFRQHLRSRTSGRCNLEKIKTHPIRPEVRLWLGYSLAERQAARARSNLKRGKEEPGTDAADDPCDVAGPVKLEAGVPQPQAGQIPGFHPVYTVDSESDEDLEPEAREARLLSQCLTTVDNLPLQDSNDCISVS